MEEYYDKISSATPKEKKQIQAKYKEMQLLKSISWAKEFDIRLGKDRYCLYRLSFEAKISEGIRLKPFLEPHTGISANCFIMNQGQPSKVKQCEKLEKHLEALDDCSLIYKEMKTTPTN